jgi:predicted metal-dependent phosphoesterase TrpH
MHPIDLHTHSTRSDGTYTPTELVHYAALKGLSAIALTDHDTIDGIEEAMQAAEALRSKALLSKSLLSDVHQSGPIQSTAHAPAAQVVPEVIPGVELSTEYKGKDIHIVGLFMDWQNREFAKKLHEFADARVYRNRKMCRLLTEHGYPVQYEDLESAFPDTVITRAHFAQYLMDHGMISSIDEAFKKLIGDDCPCFVPREKISPHDAVCFLLAFGGVPILAHPLQYKLRDDELDALVASLRALGLAGIEVYYSTHKQADTSNLSRLADKYGLLLSGGSDFHGSRKRNLDLGTGYGHLYVPDGILPPIREKAKSYRT